MTTHRRLLYACALATVSVVAVIGILWLSGGLEALVTASPHLQRGGVNPCTSIVTKTVEPATIKLCEQSQVTIGIRPSCPGVPVNIVYIIDEVYKPGYSEPQDRTDALRNSVQRLELDQHPNIRIAVVWMQDGNAREKVELTNNAQKVIGQLAVPPVSRFEARPQCFECGYREAVRILESAAKEAPEVEAYEITLLAPLGVYTTDAAPGVVRGANRAKARGAKSITTCFAWTHCVDELRQAASEPRLYLRYGEGRRLAALLHDVVRQSVETFLREVGISDVLPPEVELVPDTVSPAPDVDPGGRGLTWAFKEPIGAAYTLTYRVKPLQLGVLRLGEGASVKLIDSHFREATAPVPVAVLSVPEECPQEPTPTPSPTPPPTRTPLPTPTDTPPPTPTPVPPTSTPRPRPLYVPLAVREECVNGRAYSDVALVLDMSTTMLDGTPDGLRKIDAAQAAARTFLEHMVLAPSAPAASDQVAVIGFNRAAWTEQSLTADRRALAAAIDRLPAGVREYTRLDLAFDAGAKALRASTRPEIARVMIVLTDGLPNQVPYAEDGTVETTVLRRAQAAKDEGILLYTIGLGQAGGRRPQINAELLKSAASDPGRYYAAPSAGQLAEIYRAITRTIPCGGARYWPSR